MDGESGYGRNKKAKLIKSYNGQEEVGGYDRLGPEEIQQIKELYIIWG